ncbi:hypothetical protein [Micromonospora rubida]|uniref:hypothetical protein n=1 Tax=Micromonospora rubida TaxID=2697657 RepID=UPI00137799B7|nr:hypothetical protein [Micromonospora rubida]NBE82009.1 hypothetical protein [Micromonospora rubida]
MDPAPASVAVDPLRPRRIWYLVAALIAAGGVLTAAALLFLIPFGGDLGQFGGDLGQRVTPGQPLTVHMPETGKMVWVKGEQSLPACQYSEADTQKLEESVLVSMLADDLTLEVDGERWRGLQMMRAKPVGTYTLTCTVSDEQATSSFSIGDPPRFHDPRSKALAALAAEALATLSVLVGAVWTVVIAVRRHQRAKRPAERHLTVG